jgi:hypothetical protein
MSLSGMLSEEAQASLKSYEDSYNRVEISDDGAVHIVY